MQQQFFNLLKWVPVLLVFLGGCGSSHSTSQVVRQKPMVAENAGQDLEITEVTRGCATAERYTVISQKFPPHLKRLVQSIYARPDGTLLNFPAMIPVRTDMRRSELLLQVANALSPSKSGARETLPETVSGNISQEEVKQLQSQQIQITRNAVDLMEDIKTKESSLILLTQSARLASMANQPRLGEGGNLASLGRRYRCMIDAMLGPSDGGQVLDAATVHSILSHIQVISKEIDSSLHSR
ncbi:MAG: hypothetical protein KKB70_03055 [Proteobacteria bacterium]|nr:hypothetical protein [Pseudomonadota bacterium]MBU1610507.1 hypothetical protein [Pseudomonadota bacterium]